MFHCWCINQKFGCILQDVVKKATRVLVEDHQNIVIGFLVHWIIKGGSMLMLWFHSSIRKNVHNSLRGMITITGYQQLRLQKSLKAMEHRTSKKWLEILTLLYPQNHTFHTDGKAPPYALSRWWQLKYSHLLCRVFLYHCLVIYLGCWWMKACRVETQTGLWF